MSAPRERLRVLRLTSVFPPPDANAPNLAAFDPFGGMQSHTGQLTRAVDGLGVAQTVVTSWRPGGSRRQHLGHHATVERLGVPVRRMRQMYAVAAAVALPRLARGCGLVHVHLGEDVAALPLGMAAARLARVPLVVTVHCSLRHTYAGPGLHPWLLRTVGGAVEAVGEKRAARVIALTQRTADALSTGGVAAERVSVIPSGVDVERFAAPTVDPIGSVDGATILYVGRFVTQKDPVTAVQALGRMRARATLVMVGDGPLRPAVENAVQRYGLQRRVRLVGFVDHAAMPAYLSHADVLVLPSTYEELGSVLVEGLAAGLPAVASATGGIPSVIRDGVNGLLVPPRDAGAFAAALDRVVGDHRFRGHLATAARASSRPYNWSVLAKRVIDVYQSALEQGPR